MLIFMRAYLVGRSISMARCSRDAWTSGTHNSLVELASLVPPWVTEASDGKPLVNSTAQSSEALLILASLTLRTLQSFELSSMGALTSGGHMATYFSCEASQLQDLSISRCPGR